MPRIDALLAARILQFVDQTDEHEVPGPDIQVLLECATGRVIRVVHHRFAIPDFGVRSTAWVRAVLDAGEALGVVTYKCQSMEGRWRHPNLPETAAQIVLVERRRGAPRALLPEETLDIDARMSTNATCSDSREQGKAEVSCAALGSP